MRIADGDRDIAESVSVDNTFRLTFIFFVFPQDYTLQLFSPNFYFYNLVGKNK
jgi:hypothetical protein